MNRSLEFSEFENEARSFLFIGSKLASPMVTRDVKSMNQKDLLSSIFNGLDQNEKSQPYNNVISPINPQVVKVNQNFESLMENQDGKSSLEKLKAFDFPLRTFSFGRQFSFEQTRKKQNDEQGANLSHSIRY